MTHIAWAHSHTDYLRLAWGVPLFWGSSLNYLGYSYSNKKRDALLGNMAGTDTVLA